MSSRLRFPSLMISGTVLLLGIAFSQTSSRPDMPIDVAGKNVVDSTQAELLRSHRAELSRIEFGTLQDEDLKLLLKNAGDRVSAFYRNISNTFMHEEVRLELYRPKLSLEKTLWREFYYLILPRSGENGTTWIEERTDKKNRPVTQAAIPGFCISSGYACLNLYLHPGHQAGSRFRYLGRATQEEHSHVIAFAQRPEIRDFLAEYSDINLSVSTRFLVQGFIWLDPDTCQIARMRTHMLLPEKKTMLQDQITDVYYMKVSPGDGENEFWLPREANVRWEFPNFAYVNRHRYSDYRFFSVESEYKIAKPKVRK